MQSSYVQLTILYSYNAFDQESNQTSQLQNNMYSYNTNSNSTGRRNKTRTQEEEIILLYHLLFTRTFTIMYADYKHTA